MLMRALILAACVVICIANARTPKVIGPVRPCILGDKSCIRRNFAANSRCNPRTRPVQRQIRVHNQRFEAPHFNASYIDKVLLVTGLDKCFVSEFYFNMQSDTGVLGIDCPGLNFASERTLLQHWPLREDEVYTYTINGTYPLIRLTMTLANADTLDICKEFTFAYVDGVARFWVNPLDEPTENFLSSDLSLMNTFERETFLWRAPTLARHFINTQLCDFGCN